MAVISVHLKIGGHLFRCVLCCGEGEVPWQQISDPADGMVGDAFEHQMEIEFRIETVELGASEQRVDGGGAFSAGVGSAEEVVLSSERDDAQRAFGGVVVDLEMAVVDIAGECLPARSGVADRRSRIGLA